MEKKQCCGSGNCSGKCNSAYNQAVEMRKYREQSPKGNGYLEQEIR